MSARHTNDCPHCHLLGQHDSFDLYYCDRNGPAVVAVTNHMSHYSRAIGSAQTTTDPVIRHAKEMAINQGFFDGKISVGDALKRLRKG